MGRQSKAVPLSDVDLVVGLGASIVRYVVRFEGFIVRSSDGLFMPIQRVHSSSLSAQIKVQYQASTDTLMVNCESNMTTYNEAFVTMFYTLDVDYP